MTDNILILYMPVLHRGYLDLFGKVMPDTIGILSEDVLQDLPKKLEYIRKKDVIRAVDSKDMVTALIELFRHRRTRIVLANDHFLCSLVQYSMSSYSVTMPDEDVSHAVADEYFEKGKVTFIPGFKLRYHRNNVEENKLLVPDRRIPLLELDREMMKLASDASERSPDWYRQVGGVMVPSSGERIVAYNEHQPHDQIAATFGDPRSIFKSGVRTDLSNAEHVERILVGEAARLKVGTDKSTLYITTFPCLPCAHLTARAGVKRLFYREASYGLLDADEFLRGKGVELVEVYDEK